MKNLPILTIITATVTMNLNTAGAGFHDHLGLQLWSLREQIKTDVPGTLDLVQAYGLIEVETAGTAGMSAEQFRSALDVRGLKAVSAHVQYDALTKNLAAVIKEVQTLGASFAICPWIPHQDPFDSAAGKKAAADFNKWGEAFRAAGIRFGYHPHGYEFTKGAAAGETVFDELVQATKPENVCMAMDAFWVFHAGIDPAKLLDKYPTRWVALHVKDIRAGAATGLTTGHAPATDNVAVGSGQIDWRAVLGIAEKVGVLYYILEDETPAPLDCIPASLTYLRGLRL